MKVKNFFSYKLILLSITFLSFSGGYLYPNDSYNTSQQDFYTIIFCFHDINGKGRYSITKSELIDIFNLFKHKYKVLSLKNWYYVKKNKLNVGLPVVVLTFDDGFPSLHKEVVPLLLDYKYQATFFIYLDRYHDHSSFYKKLSDLSDDFEMGSHSFTHNRLSSNSKEIFRELYLSRKKLEHLVKKEVVSWAWPYGYYTKKLIKQAENAGYLIQVSTDYTLVKPSNKYNNMARYTIQRPQPVKRVKNILKYYDKHNK